MDATSGGEQLTGEQWIGKKPHECRFIVQFAASVRRDAGRLVGMGSLHDLDALANVLQMTDGVLCANGATCWDDDCQQQLSQQCFGVCVCVILTQNVVVFGACRVVVGGHTDLGYRVGMVRHFRRWLGAIRGWCSDHCRVVWHIDCLTMSRYAPDTATSTCELCMGWVDMCAFLR